MRLRGLSAAFWVALGLASVARAQAPTSARVETAPLELTAPDRFQVPVVFEPSRRVTLVAPSEGILRSLTVPVGASVREGAEVAQLDRTEAAARLKIAQAGVKEMQAALESVQATSPRSKPAIAQAEARLEAARAQAELAQLALDRCTLRAPFAGRVMAARATPGQDLPRRGEIAELADVSSLRVLVPVDRTAVSVGGEMSLSVEGKPALGKVQAVLPLAEAFASLRELSSPLAAAWVVVPNAGGAFEPGQRVLSPYLPTSPIATIPARAVRESGEGESGPSVQVVRNEYVTNVSVRVLGSPGPERSQVSGAFWPNDVLIVSSSLPLVAGTLIRFGGLPSTGGGIEAQAPRPGEVGEVAGITPPTGAATSPNAARATTGGLPRATQRPPARSSTPRSPSASPARPSPKAGGSAVPF